MYKFVSFYILIYLYYYTLIYKYKSINQEPSEFLMDGSQNK